METTIDAAGRVVIPKELRDRLGFRPGPVSIVVDGAGLHIEPVADDSLDTEGFRLVIPRSGTVIDDALVQALREADRR